MTSLSRESACCSSLILSFGIVSISSDFFNISVCNLCVFSLLSVSKAETFSSKPCCKTLDTSIKNTTMYVNRKLS
ncbi:hypothetical protein GLYMA_01G119000v4 [Glycine max]|uniref:Uncharacterized protein n=2 Tax=Glycine subgen. Soja TaxID=1462606 RepID=K7K3C0_SOYBN|nr:hypothetical protein JHK87_001436 [Glycine soja]KAG5069104.1 hypothetical protein JHK85_001481 [Glycine max]KAG5088828.1 hypothetical protein JHK86_001440 [Glycine max]KAH1162727.1 hypothetical protein GYH30_001284 [Glycine max]KHN25994.1 hypothetical protein glysoja_046923 [Glycine soja]